MTTMIKSFNKNSAKKFPILIFIPISQKQFYVYQLKHVFFSKFIMAGPDFGSPNHWFAGYAIN
jgi:hypothetical protein